MKFLKYLAIMPITLAFINPVHAQNDIFYTAPFHNVEVKGASMIYVNYQFDAHKQTLVCTSNQAKDVITSVEWGYKDATRKIELPVTLKDDAHFKGWFADPIGKLTITNEFGQGGNMNGSILVTCEYRNMK